MSVNEGLGRGRVGNSEKEGDPSVLDAGIIVAAQKVEHYEIAGYGSVRTFAGLLGEKKAAELLQTTLDEESEANELLNGLAESISSALYRPIGCVRRDFLRLPPSVI